MPFFDELNAFNAKQKRLPLELFARVVPATGNSIRIGSTITGSPGQPVQSGNLRASYQDVSESPTLATIGTNVVYAEQIEEGTRAGRALVLRSKVGGFHSIQKTIQGFDKLVEHERRLLVGE